MLPLRYIARVWPDHDELELADAADEEAGEDDAADEDAAGCADEDAVDEDTANAPSGLITTRSRSIMKLSTSITSWSLSANALGIDSITATSIGSKSTSSSPVRSCGAIQLAKGGGTSPPPREGGNASKYCS